MASNSITDKPELLPCPSCKKDGQFNDALLWMYDYPNDGDAHLHGDVYCGCSDVNCGWKARGYYVYVHNVTNENMEEKIGKSESYTSAKKEAIARWNRRA